MLTSRVPVERSSSPTRNVLITGAGSGIGLAVAQSLAERDDIHVWAGVRNPADIARLRSTMVGIEPIWLDITSADSIAAAVRLVRDSGRGLDALVNNAGYSLACPLEFAPLDEFRRQFEVNVFGQLAVTQAFLGQLRERAGGRIVNITSLSGYVSGPLVGPYAASKHAFASLSESMRLELRRQGVRVIQVIPGDIKTPIWDKSRSAADGLREQLAESIASRLSEELRIQYSEDLQAMRSAATRFANAALPVQRVVHAVRDAILSRRPRTHYIVGARAWGAVRLLRFLPVSVRDRVILGNLGMKTS